MGCEKGSERGQRESYFHLNKWGLIHWTTGSALVPLFWRRQSCDGSSFCSLFFMPSLCENSVTKSIMMPTNRFIQGGPIKLHSWRTLIQCRPAARTLESLNRKTTVYWMLLLTLDLDSEPAIVPFIGLIVMYRCRTCWNNKKRMLVVKSYRRTIRSRWWGVNDLDSTKLRPCHCPVTTDSPCDSSSVPRHCPLSMCPPITSDSFDCDDTMRAIMIMPVELYSCVIAEPVMRCMFNMEHRHSTPLWCPRCLRQTITSTP